VYSFLFDNAVTLLVVYITFKVPSYLSCLLRTTKCVLVAIGFILMTITNAFPICPKNRHRYMTITDSDLLIPLVDQPCNRRILTGTVWKQKGFP
jgi:hypothetical protein